MFSAIAINTAAAAAAAAKSLQSCPTLCKPIDSSPRTPIVKILLILMLSKSFLNLSSFLKFFVFVFVFVFYSS